MMSHEVRTEYEIVTPRYGLYNMSHNVLAFKTETCVEIIRIIFEAGSQFDINPATLELAPVVDMGLREPVNISPSIIARTFESCTRDVLEWDTQEFFRDQPEKWYKKVDTL